MKKNRLLSLLLVLTMLVGILVPGTIFADEHETPVAEAMGEQVINQEDEQIPEAPAEAVAEGTPSDEDPTPQDSEEPEGDIPAQQDEPQEADPPAQNEDGQNSSVDSEEKAKEPTAPAQQEEPQEPEAPAGETPAEESDDTARFESGYVRIKANTEVYADVYMIQVAGTFTADSVVYAEVNTKAEDAGDDWLKITFDMEDAKAENAAFGTAFVQEKNVQILTEEETEALLADLPDDTREYNEKKLLLASFEKAIVEATADETGKEDADLNAKKEEGEDLTPTQEEEPQEPDTPADEGSAGEASADEPQEAAHFENGYVWIKANTEVYADEDMIQLAGTFTAYSVAYAEISTKAEDAGDDWLKITFDTEAAKAEDAAFETAFVQAKNVRILTEEEAETLLADLPEDTRAYNENKLPLAFFEAAEIDEEDEGLIVDSDDIDSNNTDSIIEITTPSGETNYTIFMNEGGKATAKGKSPVTKGLIIQVKANEEEEWQDLTQKKDGATITWNKQKTVFTASFTVRSEYVEEGSEYRFRVVCTKDGIEPSEEFYVKRAFTAKVTSNEGAGIGQNAKLKAEVDSSQSEASIQGTAKYQWYFNKTDPNGKATKYTGTGATKQNMQVKISSDGAEYNYWYWCVITGSNGSATTEAVQIKKPVSPTITATKETAGEGNKPGLGEKVTFKVTAIDSNEQDVSEEITCQWQYTNKKGKWVNGVQASSYTTNEITEASYGTKYRAFVTYNGQKVVTEEIELTKPYDPVITSDSGWKLGVTKEVTIHLASQKGEWAENPQITWEVSKNQTTWEEVTDEADISEDGTAATFVINDNHYSRVFRAVVNASNGREISEAVQFSKPYTVTVTPKSKAVGVDTSVTWTASYKKAGDLTGIKWQRSTDNGETWETIGVEGTNKKHTRKIEERDYENVLFRCEVTTSKGIVHSNTVNVTRPFKVDLANPKNGILVPSIDTTPTLKIKAKKTTGTTKYKWYAGKENEDGTYTWDETKVLSTKDTYKLPAITDESYEKVYRCLVIAGNGKVYSDVIHLKRPFIVMVTKPDPIGMDLWATVTETVIDETIANCDHVLQESKDGQNWTDVSEKLVQKTENDDNIIWSIKAVDKKDYCSYERLYRVKVSNGQNIMCSNSFPIEKPFIAQADPKVWKLGLGMTATFTASAMTTDGTTDVSGDYQWYILGDEDWEALAGETAQTLDIPVDDVSVYENSYRCVMTARIDGATQRVATNHVRVEKPFEVSVTSPTVSLGSKADLTATVTGLGDKQAKCEWEIAIVRENGNLNWSEFDCDWAYELVDGRSITIDNNTQGKSILKITKTVPADFEDNVRFRCVVSTDEDGVVYSDPTMIKKAFTVTVKTGIVQKDSGSHTFKVSTGKKAATAFTWEYSENNGNSWKKVTNQGTAKVVDNTTATLQVKVNNDTLGRQFRCVATVNKKKVASDVVYVESTTASNYEYMYTNVKTEKGIKEGWAITGLNTNTELPSSLILPVGFAGMNVLEIGGADNAADGVFANQDVITSLYIPATITIIGSYAFYDCEGLTSVSLSNNVTEIGQGTFKNCSNLNSMSPY